MLPSVRARWCTLTMKIKPFERYCGKDEITSYIGIRADESKRKGYFNAKKPNIKAAYPFIDEGIDLAGVKKLLEDSGLGMPTYYDWRSRSGCYFCFFQRRIEWVNLSERHPDLFAKAIAFEESSGYAGEGRKFTWVQGMTLRELVSKATEIKKRHELKIYRAKQKASQLSFFDIRDEILEAENSDRCDTCHI